MKNRDLTSALEQLLTLPLRPSDRPRLRGRASGRAQCRATWARADRGSLYGQTHLTRRIARELLLLQRLLCLTDVSDFDTPAAEYFALINPADPAVAEICMLTDGLADCLKDLQTDDSHERGDCDVAAGPTYTQ